MTIVTEYMDGGSLLNVLQQVFWCACSPFRPFISPVLPWLVLTPGNILLPRVFASEKVVECCLCASQVCESKNKRGFLSQ